MLTLQESLLRHGLHTPLFISNCPSRGAELEVCLLEFPFWKWCWSQCTCGILSGVSTAEDGSLASPPTAPLGGHLNPHKVLHNHPECIATKQCVWNSSISIPEGSAAELVQNSAAVYSAQFLNQISWASVHALDRLVVDGLIVAQNSLLRSRMRIALVLHLGFHGQQYRNNTHLLKMCGALLSDSAHV